MSTETYTTGQVVQYRKVGRFELIKADPQYDTCWTARQVTGKRTKAMIEAGTDEVVIWLPRIGG